MDLPERITVSRNVLVTASDFDAFEMNIIAILLFILRPFMYLADKIPDPGEFFLRFIIGSKFYLHLVSKFRYLTL